MSSTNAFFDFTSVYYAHFCFSRNSINRLLTVANWFLKIFPRLRHTVVSLSISRSIRYFAHFSFQKSQLIHCTTVEWQFLFAFFLNLRHTVVSLSISRSRRGYVPHHHCPSSMTGNWYIVALKETIKELQRTILYSELPITPTPWLTWIHFTQISLTRLFKKNTDICT